MTIQSKKITGIPPEYLRDVTMAVDNARKFMQDGQDLTAVAIIVRQSDDSSKPPLPATFRVIGSVFRQGHPEDKDAFAQAVRAEAAQIQADFLIFISEAWILSVPKEHAKDPSDAKAFSEWVYRTYGSIAASPFKQDSVVFSLYTREAEYVAQAPIKKFGKTRTFDSLEFFPNEASKAGGYRFSDLLPKRPKDTK